MGILEKIKEIEFEVRWRRGSPSRVRGGPPDTHPPCCPLQMARTQKNKATEYHLGQPAWWHEMAGTGLFRNGDRH